MSDSQNLSQQSDIFSACCVRSMKAHANHNLMIVCSECNDLIKLFTDEVSYRNYLKYCDSKKRKVISGRYDKFEVVIVKKSSGKY